MPVPLVYVLQFWILRGLFFLCSHFLCFGKVGLCFINYPSYARVYLAIPRKGSGAYLLLSWSLHTSSLQWSLNIGRCCGCPPYQFLHRILWWRIWESAIVNVIYVFFDTNVNSYILWSIVRPNTLIASWCVSRYLPMTCISSFICGHLDKAKLPKQNPI